MANVTQAKASFKKYEYEDIRTEYFNLTTPAAEDIPSRQIVTVTSGAVAKTVNTTGHDKGDLVVNTINNTSIFMLAEDIKIGDKGFVYYIIDNKSNLIPESINLVTA